MTATFLLDTCVLSDLVRNPRSLVAARIALVGEAAVATSVVVAGELRFGAAKVGSARLAERVELILSRLPVLPFAPPADRIYAAVRAELERAGTPIGSNDLLIAAHALALGLTVVTANVREFERVEGLAVETWAA